MTSAQQSEPALFYIALSCRQNKERLRQTSFLQNSIDQRQKKTLINQEWNETEEGLGDCQEGEPIPHLQQMCSDSRDAGCITSAMQIQLARKYHLTRYTRVMTINFYLLN